MTTIVLYDVSNAAHRARHTINLSYRGKDTSVLYGVLRIILAGAKKYQPDSIVACYDKKYPKERKLLVPEYKAHRAKKRNKKKEVDWDDFYRQIHETQRILRLGGVIVAEEQDFEADDLIAAYIRTSIYDSATIVSSDSDMLQLVSDRVTVWNPIKDIVYDEEQVVKEYGVRPDQIALMKALAGDSSDGVPGIHGIGDKTAASIINACDATTSYQLMPCNMNQRHVDMIKGAGGFRIVQRYWSVIQLSQDMYGANYPAWCCAQGYTRFDNKEFLKALNDLAFHSIMTDSHAVQALRALKPLRFRDDAKFHVMVTRRMDGSGAEQGE